MWKSCWIIILHFTFSCGNVYTGQCSDLVPSNGTGDIIDIILLNGSVWKPIWHYPLRQPRFNFFNSSPYMFMDCIKFFFYMMDQNNVVYIMPTNCTATLDDTDADWCWMEHFLITKAADDTTGLAYQATSYRMPETCGANAVTFYIVTPDVEHILYFWTCYDFNNGSISEGLWILSPENVELDSKLFRKTRKMVNTMTSVSFWSKPRNFMDLCTCETRFGSYPCVTDDDCIEKDDQIVVAAALGVPPNFLMWYFIGVMTFAIATFAFIYFSGISDCMCNENFHAF
ncbi:hypothetical protein DMENIID0001_153090 [Sergentomyia squamirostris]